MLGNAFEIFRNKLISLIDLLIQLLLLLSDMISFYHLFSACFHLWVVISCIFLHVPMLYLSMTISLKGKHINNKKLNRIITCYYIFIQNS